MMMEILAKNKVVNDSPLIVNLDDISVKGTHIQKSALIAFVNSWGLYTFACLHGGCSSVG